MTRRGAFATIAAAFGALALVVGAPLSASAVDVASVTPDTNISAPTTVQVVIDFDPGEAWYAIAECNGASSPGTDCYSGSASTSLVAVPGSMTATISNFGVVDSFTGISLVPGSPAPGVPTSCDGVGSDPCEVQVSVYDSSFNFLGTDVYPIHFI
ncbi:MAG: hypothetical protein QM598_07975 [Protaetiibacter sp.]